MVLVDLISTLKNDKTLKSLLNATITESKIHPMPCNEDGISYNYNDLTNDALVRQSQFKATIIHDDLMKCYEIKERVDNLLITLGDQSFNKDIMSIAQTGGGFFYDADLQKYKVVTIYTIQERMM